MLALLQRVSHANVVVDGHEIARIHQGLLVLVGVQPHDDDALCIRMAEKILAYRCFADAAGKMNLNVREVAGGVLMVPQFTLAADTRKGLRPSFTSAAPPQQGADCFHLLVNTIREHYVAIEVGQFQADMKVSLCNDGPVTFLLEL